MSLLSKIPGLAKHRAEIQPEPAPAPPPQPAPDALPRHFRGVSAYGRPYVLAERERDVPALRAVYSEPVFTRDELDFMRGMSKEEGDFVLMTRSVFPEAPVERIKPLGKSPGENALRRVR